MQKLTEEMISKSYLAKDRYGRKEYLIDHKTYYHIMDLIHFYHESIYTLPDDETVHTFEIENSGYVTSRNIPVNHLMFD